MKCKCGAELKVKNYGTSVAIQENEGVAADLYVTVELSCSGADCSNKYTATITGPLSLYRVIGG